MGMMRAALALALAASISACASQPKVQHDICKTDDPYIGHVDIRADVKNGDIGWTDDIGQWHSITHDPYRQWICRPDG